ncbi:DUF262 domain-containing protein [Listeria booriae]|uniref:DUF262 domain-containing protein n=1 Tax=Listeria booriae TaxID=1552123 RepID=UPI0016255559|nr:DUF262 domain-containing protein [Listeria booriae]MBC1247359.1 DUF262 domain-containing protein [Listeria booriae]
MGNLKETKVYSINDFLNWSDNGELELSPKYQRKAVWNSKAESYLIDTIVRGLPIPQVFIRQSIDTSVRRTNREVIDGQQRLRTIIKFVNNEFSIMPIHNQDLGKKYYNDLEESVKRSILDYQIPVELIKTDDDSIVYDMFMRVNTNSYTLNKQELRNAKYWGDFKVVVYKLSSIWRPFFQDNKVFKDGEFLRMSDAEYVSSLLILTMDGIKSDTPTKIDNYYIRYDDNLPGSERIEYLFNNTMEQLKNILDNELYTFKYFTKKNYLYTLFCYVLLTNGELENYKEEYQVTTPNTLTLRNILLSIESLLSLERSESLEEVEEFIRLHKTRTTNEIERKQRLQILLNLMRREQQS